MKKLLAVLMIGLAATSYGIVNVNWSASGGFYFAADPMVGILGADNSGNSTFAQLMYSPDAVQDAGSVLTGIYLDGAGYNGGNDVIWSRYAVTADGSPYSGYALLEAQNYQQAFVSGYVYAMIFQDNSYQWGDWIFYTPMMALEDITGLMIPQSIQMNNDVDYGDPIDSGSTVSQVIPEPSTALLLGTGGMVVWFGRRKLNRAVGTKVTPKKMRKVDLLHR